MSKKAIILALFILLVTPLISAETEITVKTNPNHDVAINILNEESDVIESFTENSGDSGDAKFISSATQPQIDLVVMVRKNGKIITLPSGNTSEKIENKKTGSSILVDLRKPVEIPKSTEAINETGTNKTAEENITLESGEPETPEANATIEAIPDNEEEASEEVAKEKIEQQNKSKLTGAFLSWTKDVIFSKTTLYIIIVIIGIAVLFSAFLILRKKLHFEKGPYIDFKIKEKIKDKSSSDYDRKLLDAEKKIKEAMAEVEELKEKKKKLTDAQERFEKAKEELEKLKKDDWSFWK